MIGIETGGASLAVERNGASLGVAPTDDPYPIVLVVWHLL
jgi:hypothetical protein